MPKFCPNCGQGVTEKNKFCPECGTDFATFQQNSNNKRISNTEDNEITRPPKSTIVNGITKLSGIVNHVTTEKSTYGSVYTNQGYVSGYVNTDHWTKFRINNRPCSYKWSLNLSEGDRVIVAGEGTAELQVLALHNQTTNVIYSAYSPHILRIFGLVAFALPGIFGVFACLVEVIKNFWVGLFFLTLVLGYTLLLLGYAWHLNNQRKKVENCRQMVSD